MGEVLGGVDDLLDVVCKGLDLRCQRSSVKIKDEIKVTFQFPDPLCDVYTVCIIDAEFANVFSEGPNVVEDQTMRVLK